MSTNNNGRVQGKVAIVTGGAKGLGEADARFLSAEGATVIITDVDKAGGEKTANSIEGASFFYHDVRDEAQWEALIHDTEKRFGRLDILVNNAGIAEFTTVVDTPLEQFRLLNSVMSEGTFLGCKHAIPAMERSGGGSIINVSSIVAVRGMGVLVSYAAAKGAILGITKSVAAFCNDADNNVRCNVIIPGTHDTPMVAQAQAALGDAATIPHGKPEDVAQLVLYLASDESRFLNGSEIVIDKGESL